MHKKILQVRFVNFGNKTAVEVLLRIDCAAVNFFAPAMPNHPYLSDFTVDYFKVAINKHLSTLNSGNAPVPRLEVDNDCGWKLFSTPTSYTYIKGNQLEALQHANIFGKEAEIYTPKKYEANWKRLYPRSEINVPDAVAERATEENQEFYRHGMEWLFDLQQTEAGGLEVHELIVYEV